MEEEGEEEGSVGGGGGGVTTELGFKPGHTELKKGNVVASVGLPDGLTVTSLDGPVRAEHNFSFIPSSYLQKLLC